jgi:flagellar protein FliS
MTTATENPYLRDAILTATPEQLQLMLYDGVIRHATQGKEAIQRKDYEASYEKLTRAQQILLEMQSALNYEVNAELCRRVASIYNFLYRKLVDACVERDVGAIDDALRVLRIERETWQILVDKVNKAREQRTTGASPATSSTAETAPAEEDNTGFTAEA